MAKKPLLFFISLNPPVVISLYFIFTLKYTTYSTQMKYVKHISLTLVIKSKKTGESIYYTSPVLQTNLLLILVQFQSN